MGRRGRKANANCGPTERMRWTTLKFRDWRRKALGQADRHLCLKPYWGKPDVRNFRGGGGDGVTASRIEAMGSKGTS